jgi:dimeric dUTPase (all-alpha-NTP-PPase superfamily)
LNDIVADLIKVDIPIGLINTNYKEQLSDLFDEVEEVTKMKATVSDLTEVQQKMIVDLKKQRLEAEEKEKAEEDEALKDA